MEDGMVDQEGGSHAALEKLLVDEVRQVREDVAELYTEVAKLSTIEEQLDLHTRLSHLEKFRWAMPATAVLAIAIAIVGGIT